MYICKYIYVYIYMYIYIYSLPSTIPLTSGPQMQLPPVPMTWHSPPNALPAEWKLHFGAPLAGWISVVCKGEPPEPAQDDPPQAAV